MNGLTEKAVAVVMLELIDVDVARMRAAWLGD